MAESQSREVYFLKQVSGQKYNKDFAVSMVQMQTTIKQLSKYLITMQQGIDDLNRDIIEVIRDLIEEIIIIFNGGDLSGLDFDWGDLYYVFKAIGSFFGFPTWSGGTAWNPFQMVQNFFNNFLSPLTAFQNTIGTLIDNVINVILGWLSWVPGVGTVREKLAGAINNATSTATSAQTTAVSAQGTADVANTVAVYTTFNVTSNKPLSRSLDPTAETSFDFQLLATNNGESINTVTITQTVARFAKIRVGNDQIMNTMSYLAYKSGTVSAFYYDIYKFRNNDSGWDLLYSSPNLAPDLTTALAKPQYLFSVPGLPFTATEKYAIQFRMNGSGTVYMAGKNFPTVFVPGFEPEVLGASRDPSATPTPMIITNAQMDTYNDAPVPYIEIGSNVGQVGIPRSWYVNFNNSSWNGWVRQHYAANGKDLKITDGVVEYDGTTDGYQYAYFGSQTATDDMEAQIYFNRSSPIRSAVGICHDNNGMGGLVLAVDSSGVYFSKQNSLGSFTQKASYSYTSGGGTYKIRYVSAGNYFIAYKYNPVGDTWFAVTDPWYDTANEIQHGIGRRFGGIVMNRGFFQTGAGMDDFYLRDWNV